MNTSVGSRAEHVALPVGARVDVHTRHELGRWARGFTIAEVRPDGYRIKRTSDGAVLSQTIHADEIRLASPVPTRSHRVELLGTVPSGTYGRSTAGSRIDAGQ
jgi:hypothetical protein